MKTRIYKISDKYVQFGQKYSECQLVSALNAAYWLGEDLIHPNSDEYERIVDFAGCRHGSAICISYVYRYLKLRYIDVKPEFESVEFANEMNLPIGLGVFTKKHGLHDVLIIQKKHNDENGGYKVRVLNLFPYTDDKFWIHWKELEKLVIVKENIGPEYGYFRIFYRDPVFNER